MHGLIRKRSKLGSQCGNHPARQVQIALAGIVKVFLDGNQFLLPNKAMPATQRLSVLTTISIVLVHILTHNRGGVLGDVQPGFKAILQAHTRS